MDGHFQKAGFDPTLIAECHGSIPSLRCLNGVRASIWSVDEVELEIEGGTVASVARPIIPAAFAQPVGGALRERKEAELLFKIDCRQSNLFG